MCGTASLSMSIRHGAPPRAHLGLERRRLLGSGAASRPVSLIAPFLARSLMSSHGSLGSVLSRAANSRRISSRSSPMKRGRV